MGAALGPHPGGPTGTDIVYERNLLPYDLTVARTPDVAAGEFIITT